MKHDQPQFLVTPAPQDHDTDHEASGHARLWRWAGAVLVLVIVGQLYLHRETLLSMVALWNRSETYTHGWIIPPISAYLIWLRRQDLSKLMPSPSVLGTLLWAILNVAWLIGHLAGALVVTQYAVFAMIPALVWALLGTAVAWTVAFPLIFLLLAVPSGEAMVPTLIDFTADFTVKMLQLTGIPVYREGTYFSVPSGDWNVVEACSGIRYLIASFTGGCLFAYLYYRSAWKRLTVIVASILIPIAANGLRAYMIVMIGHLSDMRLAVGVDHFIYGWVFFGMVMFALFWVASLWRETDGMEVESVVPGIANRGARPRLPLLLMTALALCVAGGVWRSYGTHLDSEASQHKPVQLPEIAAREPWRAVPDPGTGWEPRFRGFDQSISQGFAQGDAVVQLKVLYYRGQTEGRELISSTNLVIRPSSDDWRVTGHRTLTELGGEVRLQETDMKQGDEHLLVWHWNVVDGRAFINPFLGKWLLARDRILGQTGEGAAVFIAVRHRKQPDIARAQLRAFMGTMNTGIIATLGQVKDR